jgi:hypothetical protein
MSDAGLSPRSNDELFAGDDWGETSPDPPPELDLWMMDDEPDPEPGDFWIDRDDDEWN